MTKKKPTETGATKRAFRMAAMTAGVTGSYLGYYAQRAFLGEKGREAKLKATHTKAARRMTDELVTLRGPAMKLGQALSLQTGVFPEETLAELASLQMDAPGMHSSLVRAQFKASMGQYPEQIFRDFETSPFAAASLGQVHHAHTLAGDDVVVKIQYPGIRDAIAGDFKWFRTVSKAAQMSRVLPALMIDELQTQIEAETDYHREADNLEFFREKLASLEYVTTPRVYRKYSSDRVLTMSFVPGNALEDVLRHRPPQRERDLLGEHLLELFYFQVLHLGVFHSDPHWGNYRFGRNGAVGLVDFGSVKHLSPKLVRNLCQVFLYSGDRHSADFARLIDERYELFGIKVSPKSRGSLVRFAEEFYGRVYPPQREKEDARIDFADAAILKSYMRLSGDVMLAKATLPDYIMMARAETGLYQTLHRLKARVRTSRIVRRWLS